MTDKRLIILDNFLPNPIEVRNKILAGEFKDRQHTDGATYRNIHLPDFSFADELSRRLGRAIDLRLNLVRADFGGIMPHHAIHADATEAEFATVLYLNLPEQCQGGTSFWAHKATGWNHVPTPGESRALGRSPKMLAKQISSDVDDLAKWEQTQLAEMKFNRLISYPSKRFHSRWPLISFGDRIENARLVWVGFWDLA